jgi:hypothetical protein
MIKDMAWNAFKKTGDINVYLEFKETKKLEENIKGSLNETDKSKWSDITRK